MRVPLISSVGWSSCSNGYAVRLLNKPQFLRNISNKASTARTATPKHVSATADKVFKPKSVAPPSKRAPGAFRPELFRYLNQESPTILVQSQSPFVYRLGMYMLGGFCIAYGVVNYYTVLHDPPTELSSFVKGTHYSINIAMVCFGIFCAYKTTRIISSISAIPYVVNKATGQKGLMLQIQTYRTFPLPGRGPKITQAPADEVFTNTELGVPGMYNSTPLPPTRDEKIAERMYMRQVRRREHQKNISRLYTLPFREAGQFIGRAFVGLREAVYGDGWVHLRIKSRNGTWRVGKEFEWALDAGHAFDKVIKVDRL